jgi:ribulose-5-phosphate 4-epimerase/fuculose-1-phosphate aldolase
MTNEKRIIDEGSIKFNCQWINEPLSIIIPAELLNWRDKMYELKQIGYYPELNIGYGNISLKMPQGILISGTQTGNIYPIQPEHFTLVTNFNLDQNKVICRGLIKASSESMTHLAIYQSDKSINAIIHIHNFSLWQNLTNKVPTTNKNVLYGTPEMAKEIYRLFQETNVKQEKIIVMAGHQEGIISFGFSLEEAGNILLNFLS